MARVLISFLGTGPFTENEKGIREYKNAKYRIEDKEYETPFVSAALADYLNIDKKIILGTSKSMWEEYYRYFYENDDNFDDGLYFDIADFSDKASFKTEEFPFAKKLESIFTNSSIIILKYGLDNSELEYNLLRILEIDNLINDGDELYIDVTHGFRSFPLLAQEIVLYLKQVSKKNIAHPQFFSKTAGKPQQNRHIAQIPEHLVKKEGMVIGNIFKALKPIYLYP